MAKKVLVRLKNGECAQRDLPIPSAAGLKISASVGAGGKNIRADVEKIQRALNSVPPAQGGPVVLLEQDGAEYDIDARPSDAIAIALRADAPIFVADAVLDRVGLLRRVGDEHRLRTDSALFAEPAA